MQQLTDLLTQQQQQNMSKKKVTTTTTTVVEETVENKKPTKTYYAFVVDRSGSMLSRINETIDNFNEQIQTLKRLEKENPNEKYYVTLCMFNDQVETVYEDKPLNEVEELTRETYVPGGMTALYDAIGITIYNLKKRQKKNLKKKKGNEALVMILTDGYENKSQEYSQDTMSKLIKKTEKKDNWSISFIGADKESAMKAKTYGINNTTFLDYSSNRSYTSTSAGISQSLTARSKAKVRGASLNKAMFAATTDASGQMVGTLDEQKLEDEIQKQTSGKKESSKKEEKSNK